MEVLKQINLPAETRLLLAAGHFGQREGMFNAAWALEMLRYSELDLSMVLFGDGPKLSKAEQTANGMAPEGSRNYFLGARADLPLWYPLADIVLLPQSVGGANIALEAMATGKAIIAARTPIFSELLRDGETGLLVEPGNANELAKAILRLLRDEPLRQRLGENARREVTARFSLARLVDQWRLVYTLGG